MEVDYLLYHEDRNKIERMLEGLKACADGLFNPNWRKSQGLDTTSRRRGWHGVTLRDIKKVGRNVLQYNFTLPSRHVYPTFVAAVLIDNEWEVKVRYRNVVNTPDGPWTYIKCEFPEGTEYALPDGWLKDSSVHEISAYIACVYTRTWRGNSTARRCHGTIACNERG